MFNEIPIKQELIDQMTIDTKRAARVPSAADRRGFDKRHLNTLGAIIVADYLKADWVDDEGYDFIYHMKKISVMTQSCDAQLIRQGVMTGWVKKEEERLDTDIYVFVRVDMEMKLAWIGGWIPVEEFYKIAKEKNEGAKMGCVVAFDSGWSIGFDRLAAIEDLGMRFFHPRRPS